MAVQNITLKTVTELSYILDNVEIHTFYTDTGEYQRFFIAEESGNIGGVVFDAGDLVYLYQNVVDEFSLDADGNMIVLADDADDYSINENGELIKKI